LLKRNSPYLKTDIVLKRRIAFFSQTSGVPEQFKRSKAFLSFMNRFLKSFNLFS